MPKKKVSARSLSKMPHNYPDIAERFAEFKKSTGLTYDDLAKAIGSTFSTLQACASGRITPNFYIMRQLKKKFGLDYDWLIDGTKNKKKGQPLVKKIEAIKQLMTELEGTQ